MTPNTRIFAATSLGVIALDQVTKYLVRANLRPRTSADDIPLIPDFLAITHAQNKGAALSAMADFEHRLLVFYVFTAVAAGVILWTFRQLAPEDRLASATLGTLLGGALGNLIDRIAFGQVTDMIKVYAGAEPLKSWTLEHFSTNVYPIFNVADIAIWVGVIGYVLPWFRQKDSREDPVGPEASRPDLN